MDRFGAAPACRVEDRIASKVTLLRPRTADRDRDVGEPRVLRARIGLRVDRDGLNAESPAGADHAAGDLAAVRDQEPFERGHVSVRLRCLRTRIMPKTRAVVSTAASEPEHPSIVAEPASPAQRSETEWLERGRALVLRSDLDGALATFEAAHAEHPASADITLALAGVLWQAKQPERAESVLRALLATAPTHVAATFLLAKILKEQARMNAVATTVRALFAAAPQPVGTTIQAVELLDDAGRKQDAADLCEAAIAHGSTDPRIYAYAGMLHLQLGDCAHVRER
jgi:hypothetical protein